MAAHTPTDAVVIQPVLPDQPQAAWAPWLREIAGAVNQLGAKTTELAAGGGSTGPAGPPGPTGPAGPTGPTGATGATGPAGATGATGPAGSANMSGMVAGQIPIAASATSVTSSTGALAGSFMPAYTGDVTSAAGGTVNTLATVNSNVGTFQGLTVNAKGLVTAAANQSYAPLASPSFTGNVTVAGSVQVGGSANPNLSATTAGGTYTQLWAPDGSGFTRGIFLGASGNPTSFYRNDAHQLDNVNGSVAYAIVNATSITLNSGGVVVGSPTGGAKGAGTLNAVTVYGNNVVLTSDASLKRDIQSLPACLPMVRQIEPKGFRWKPLEPRQDEDPNPPGFTDSFNRGFLAQDVAAVLGGAEDTVDLGGMVAVLWQAVRELSARLEAYEAR